MADPKGFLRLHREGPARRPVALRLQDWHEVYLPFPAEKLREQAARCMDCGIPFCHEGCPLGNLIPEWNDLVYRDEMSSAVERLAATNNFPEFTGRLCPAPCEGACVLGISDDAVAIKQVEYELAEEEARRGLVPVISSRRSGKSVAVVGSGPAGLAAAQQLTRAGHRVVVFERAERLGGLLRYGVPEFKLEKSVIDRRIVQMVEEGTEFRTRTAVGALSTSEIAGTAAPDAVIVSVDGFREQFDAIVLATGSTRPRDLEVPGRDQLGVHFAMDYLKRANLVLEDDLTVAPISAAGKHVVIIGGGDTGADCLGTVHRQGAASVRQLEILPEPPSGRSASNPWPTWPLILRSSAAHEEGGERLYAIGTSEFLHDTSGQLRAIRVAPVERDPASGAFLPLPDGEHEIETDLVLLALGFVGPEAGLLAELALERNGRGNVAINASYETAVEGVFACGDCARGQSLVVWAIAEGRSAAATVDRYLMGDSSLPTPIAAGSAALA